MYGHPDAEPRLIFARRSPSAGFAFVLGALSTAAAAAALWVAILTR